MADSLSGVGELSTTERPLAQAQDWSDIPRLGQSRKPLVSEQDLSAGRCVNERIWGN